MKQRATTPDRILDAARKLFNEKGYASTTLTEIATSVGIAQGNLSYHFPTKADLAKRLQEQSEETMRSRWETKQSGNIVDDYIEHLVFAMRLTWNIRFLLRDHAQFSDSPNWLQTNRYTLLDFEELCDLLKRMQTEDLFRDELDIELDVLARSLWIISRYWLDHLRELEGDEALPREDLERGVRHHFTLLSHFLRPSASENFRSAIETALRLMKNFDSN